MTAWRFRWNKNTDTPWPPDEPTMPNPADGVGINYLLSPGVSGPVTIDIVDPAGGTNRVIRHFSSEDADEPLVAIEDGRLRATILPEAGASLVRRGAGLIHLRVGRPALAAQLLGAVLGGQRLGEHALGGAVLGLGLLGLQFEPKGSRRAGEFPEFFGHLWSDR